jgi:polysaccharide chain length determinant protein (PEP-CTERM system associated)
MLFIQQQRVESKLIERPDKEEMRERLEALVQELLARPRLRNIVERFNLYPDLRGPIGMDGAITLLRNNIELNPVVSPTGKQLLQTFRLEFTDGDPTRAYEVTRALSNLFIEESMVDRRTEIQSTQEFLEAQLKDARQKLEETENKVQEFVRANFGQLPDHLEAAIARLENAQQQLATNSQLLNANATRRANLDSEYKDQLRLGATAPVEARGSGESDPKAALAQLESALVVLMSKYSDKHPDVINTRQRIEGLREQIAAGSRVGVRRSILPSGRIDAARSLKRTIDELEVQQSSLKDENTRLKATIEKLQADIEAMPIKEQELLKIKRDYTQVKENYERLLVAREEAALKASLVKSQKDTQFRIVEPAELPVEPSGPNRLLLVGGSTILGVVVLLALLVLCYVLNMAYKTRDDLEDELGLPIIGVIPPMQSASKLFRERRMVKISAACSLIFFVVGSMAVVFLL